MKKKAITKASATGWSNVSGSGDQDCKCTSWKDHWLKYSGQGWPATCSVIGAFYGEKFF